MTGSTKKPATVVREYLRAFYSGEFAEVRLLLAESFSFQGPFLSVEGADAFLEGAAGLQPIVRGARVLRQWEDDADVSTLYEVDLETPAGAGSLPMSEWHTVRDGRLVSGRVLFDTAAFRRFLPGDAA